MFKCTKVLYAFNSSLSLDAKNNLNNALLLFVLKENIHWCSVVFHVTICQSNSESVDLILRK